MIWRMLYSRAPPTESPTKTIRVAERGLASEEAAGYKRDKVGMRPGHPAERQEKPMLWGEAVVDRYHTPAGLVPPIL